MHSLSKAFVDGKENYVSSICVRVLYLCHEALDSRQRMTNISGTVYQIDILIE